MKLNVLLTTLLIPLLVAPTLAENPKVTELGAAEEGPILGPMKFSPDSKQLAFMRGSQLMIADSVGDVTAITELTPPPMRWEWLSCCEIIVHQRTRVKHDSGFSVLSVVNIETSVQTVLEEHGTKLYSGSASDEGSFDGPRLTAGGDAFYYKHQDGDKKVMVPESSYSDSEKNTSNPNNLYVEWKDDGLYGLNPATGKAAKIAEKPFPHIMSIPVMSPDGKYVASGGMLMKLEDQSLIFLDTILKEPPPPGTDGCGFIYPNFIPGSAELLIALTCDDGHSVVVDRMCIFNYATCELTMLDDVVGLSNCKAPTVSHDGKKMAFIANGKAYIYFRGK